MARQLPEGSDHPVAPSGQKSCRFYKWKKKKDQILPVLAWSQDIYTRVGKITYFSINYNYNYSPQFSITII